MVKNRQYIKFLLAAALVAFSCLNISILNHFKFYDTYIDEEAHINRRWVLWNLNTEQPGSPQQLSLYKRKIVARTNYPVVISQPYKINNKNICAGFEKVSCIVLVHSAPNHFERRVRMRATWLNSTHYSPESLRVVFLFGLVSDSFLQSKIEKENELYKDIVQGNFIDSYRNLTNKGVMGFKWISEHCRNAEFVTKIDDDIFINFFKLFEEMSYLKHKKKYILCNKIYKGSMRIIRRKTSKWYVNEDEFKDMKRYPLTYCSGFTVFMSADLVPMLYHAAIGSPFFWVDDFYLFGVLPSKVSHVIHDSFKHNFTLKFREGWECYQRNGRKCKYFVMPAKERDIIRMWTTVTKDRRQSIYGNFYMNLPQSKN